MLLIFLCCSSFHSVSAQWQLSSVLISFNLFMLICIYCLLCVCDAAYYVCVSVFVHMCMVFHRFSSSDHSKAWPGGDSLLYISLKAYPLPPNLPTDHSKLTTLWLFLSFSLCGRGWTYSFPITQLHDLWPLQGLIETTTPTVSRGQPLLMIMVKHKLN